MEQKLLVEAIGLLKKIWTPNPIAESGGVYDQLAKAYKSNPHLAQISTMSCQKLCNQDVEQLRQLYKKVAILGL